MKVSVLCPHYRIARWLLICVWNFKRYGFGVPWEMIVCDNSPGHPSVKILTETDLGKDVKVVAGDPDFPSHGYGYLRAYEQADGDAIFTTESDCLPLREGWALPFIQAFENHSLIGPEMPMAAGRYIHPGGAMYSRELLEAHRAWRKKHADWMFVTDCTIQLGLTQKGQHITCKKDWWYRQRLPIALRQRAALWGRDLGPWQEMMAWDDDTYENYGRRTLLNLRPSQRDYHLRIGLEPGQHVSSFAHMAGFGVMRAPLEITWMPGMEGRQAAFSTIFNGFTHVWAGASSFCDGIDPKVREFKHRQLEDLLEGIPKELVDYARKLDS